MAPPPPLLIPKFPNAYNFSFPTPSLFSLLGEERSQFNQVSSAHSWNGNGRRNGREREREREKALGGGSETPNEWTEQLPNWKGEKKSEQVRE